MQKTDFKKNITNIVAEQKIGQFLNLDGLPDEMNISTVTVTCQFDTSFDLENIGKYMQLTQNRVVYIKYGRSSGTVRTLIPVKQKAKRKKKKVKVAFYNQVTLKVVSSYKDKDKPTNVKLFKNGSLQLTGCVSVENFVEVLMIVCEELRKVRAVLELPRMNKMILKPFVGSPQNLDVSKVKNIKIRMINSNFYIGFRVNRDQLYQLLLSENVDCRYEPCVHACVNLKYYHMNKDRVSIFVFESGAVIITGGKTQEHINGAYEFITKKLFDNYKKIVKTDIDDVLEKNGGLNQIMLELLQ
jgi:TATA-box binding protein (TBP) (component of TFIID and TFIIIB)